MLLLRTNVFSHLQNAVEFRIDVEVAWCTMPQGYDKGKLWKFSEGLTNQELEITAGEIQGKTDRKR